MESCISFLAVPRNSYEASLAAVHPGRVSLPKGQIFLAAGGWTIVAIHESKESWEQNQGVRVVET